MRWTTVLKKRNLALEVIGRDLYKLDLEFFGPIYGIKDLIPYGEQVKRGDLDEEGLIQIIDDSIYEFDKYLDKGLTENERHKEITDKYEKVRADIQRSKDVKDWDDGK